MLVRTSQALILCPDNGQTVAFNFLRQTSFVCNEELLRLLHFLSDWQPSERLSEIFPDYEPAEIKTSLDALADVGGVVIHGSVAHNEEAKKIESWEWGIPSAMLHYCEQNRKFVSRSEAEEIQRERATNRPTPDLYKLNSQYETVHALNDPLGKGSILDLMAKRRTQRDVEPAPVTLNAVSDCLFAGMGIISQTQNCVGTLPLSMTPSGGARNPYEAYLYAANIDGLEAGFYHYSAVEHSLGLVKPGRLDDPAALVGDQEWINTMSGIIFLCADFSRTMWKYQDNNAYRVVLIEAGHIGQNIMLAATEHGLTACPSAALSHEKIATHLQLDHDLQSPVYALMLGVPQTKSANGHLH